MSFPTGRRPDRESRVTMSVFDVAPGFPIALRASGMTSRQPDELVFSNSPKNPLGPRRDASRSARGSRWRGGTGGEDAAPVNSFAPLKRNFGAWCFSIGRPSGCQGINTYKKKNLKRHAHHRAFFGQRFGHSRIKSGRSSVSTSSSPASIRPRADTPARETLSGSPEISGCQGGSGLPRKRSR